MANISYQQFIELLSNYSSFDEKHLKAMCDEYGKNIVDKYFDKYYQSLDEKEMATFMKKYSVYFEQQVNDLEEMEIYYDDAFDVCNWVIKKSLKHSLMSREVERGYALILEEAKKNLNIVRNINDNTILYPNLNLEKIFLSVKTKEDLESIFRLKKLPYHLHDESILKNDFENIKKFLKASSDGILTKSELEKIFPDLNFDDIDVIPELAKQIELLENYILAKYNLYNQNLRLVVFFARKCGYQLSIEDRIQEGIIGLIKAINKYDISRGFRFSTYATWWIRQNIMRSVADTGFMIRKPVYLTERIRIYKNYVDKYRTLTGVYPSREECCLELGFSIEEVSKLETVSCDVISLEFQLHSKEFDDSTESVIDYLIDDKNPIEREVVSGDFTKFVLEKIESTLSEREKLILINRWGLNSEGKIFTLEELGSTLGITRERVRQLEQKAKNKVLIKLKDSIYS